MTEPDILCNCGQIAVYVESAPDPNRQGVNMNECGYRLKPLCSICAIRRKSNTQRIEPISRDNIEQLWSDLRC